MGFAAVVAADTAHLSSMAYGDRVKLIHRSGSLVCALTVLAVLPTPSLVAATNLEPIGTWSMVPQSKDANGDGFIDGDGGVPSSGALSLQPANTFIGAGNYVAQPNERLIGGSLSWYLDPAGYPVSLNACKSKGTSFSWTVQRGGQVVLTTPVKKLTKKSCKTTVTLPEGPHSLQLKVQAGSKAKRISMAANISNYLMVVMGDSYASGEGNPRNVQAWIKNRGSSFSPYWDNDQCNRSVHGGPAQAALRLEKASNKSSVTLVDVSCSGATIDRGILGNQFATTKSQVEQVAELIGTREIDALSLTVGGNDVGFSSILTTCALTANCPVSKASNGPLAPYPTVQTGVQALTAQLANQYSRINSCLTDGSCLSPRGAVLPSIQLSAIGKVFLSSYPDLTRDSNGSMCSYLTITREDFQWSRDTILSPAPANPFAYTTTRSQVVNLDTAAGSLNGQINATSNLGWIPVMGIWGASGESETGHGVCAGSNAWIFGLTGLTGFTSGSFHPNPEGQTVIGQQIFAQIKASGI